MAALRRAARVSRQGAGPWAGPCLGLERTEARPEPDRGPPAATTAACPGRPLLRLGPVRVDGWRRRFGSAQQGPPAA